MANPLQTQRVEARRLMRRRQRTAAAAVALAAGAAMLVLITHTVVFTGPGSYVPVHEKTITYSLLATGIAICLATMFVARRFYRRVTMKAPKNRCGQCGYDLRGSGDVCPECGTKRLLTASDVATKA